MGGRAGSWRRTPLPPNWETELRPAVLARDGYRCRWPAGPRICGLPASQVDHINPGGPDELWNLQALCPGHHASKTGREAGAAWGKLRRQMATARHRPGERHPGLT
jgi:5-methylcytosine-specific restriction endonuclease McrA